MKFIFAKLQVLEELRHVIRYRIHALSLGYGPGRPGTCELAPVR
jgi:hypothetical protein